ncbi:MAG: hypothetical protein K6A92_00155 [Lachnospiraceae bacterium]|nr:hypothetical protein [Lachnospiraceae bacterium]
MEQFFDVLEIQPTKDEAAIGAAYRKLLPSHHPEEDPEGFRKLREAYEKALEYARTKEDGEGAVGDMTPADTFMNRVRGLYEDYDRRVKIEEWEDLLKDPVLQDLEYEDEARVKLLSYIMDGHEMMPQAVYSLLEKMLMVQERREDLEEHLDPRFLEFFLECANGSIDRGFDFSAIYGFTDHPDGEAVDRFIGGLYFLANPQTEWTEEMFNQVSEYGYSHPWFVFLRKCYAYSHNLLMEKEMDAFIRECLDIEKDHITGLEYRAYLALTKYYISQDKTRDAFFYIRQAERWNCTEEVRRQEYETGSKLADELLTQDEMDENTFLVLLSACHYGKKARQGLEYVASHPREVEKQDVYHYFLYMLHEAEGEYDAAFQELEKSEKTAEGDSPRKLTGERVRMYMAMEAYEQVEKLCREAAEDKSEQPNLYLYDAWQQACEKMNWPADVVQIFFEAREIWENYMPFYERAARAYAGEGIYRSAIRVLEPVAQYNPPFLKDLAEYHYQLFCEDLGHCAPEEAEQARSCAKAYEEQFGRQWWMPLQDGWMKVLEGKNDAALLCLEEALKLLGNAKEEEEIEEEEYNRKAADILIKEARAMITNRTDVTNEILPEESPARAMDKLREVFSFAKSNQMAYETILCAERMLDCAHKLGIEAELKDLLLDLEKEFANVPSRFPVQYFIDHILCELYASLGDPAQARKRLTQKLHTGVIPPFWCELPGEMHVFNPIPEGMESSEILDDMLTAMVQMPQMFTKEELRSAVPNACRSIENWINSGYAEYTEPSTLCSYVLSLIKYGPALSSDYNLLLGAGENPLFLKHFGEISTPEKRRGYYADMMRLAHYAGRIQDQIRYATEYKKAEEEANPYCRDYRLPLEEAAYKEKTGCSRFRLRDLATVCLFQGKIEDAKRMAEELKEHPMCWYCTKSGCLEYYLLLSEIAMMEGNVEGARENAVKCSATEWHKHDETAQAVLVYLDKLAKKDEPAEKKSILKSLFGNRRN